MAQFLGPRATYLYVSDSGEEFTLQLDSTLATLPGTGLRLATTADNASEKPKRFKPRGIYWQDAQGRRKFIVCNVVAEGYYTAGGSVAIVIPGTTTADAAEGISTGMRGEQRSYPKLVVAQEAV